MINTHRRRIPMGAALIAAAVLLVSVFTNPVEVSRTIAEAHGLPSAVGTWILPAVAVLAVLMAYGLLTVSRWGFFLTVIYEAVFGVISMWLLIQRFQQPYIGNATWSWLVLVYLIAKRRIFLQTTEKIS
jgi:hypothetical protein